MSVGVTAFLAAASATASAADTERVAILLGLFTLLGTAITAGFAYMSNRNARQAKTHAAEANDAVNHRHGDQPRLFDTVNNMQGQMNNLHRSVLALQDLHQSQHSEVMSEVSEVRQELRTHMEWEQSQKYWDGVERRKSHQPYLGIEHRFPEEP